MTEPTVGVGAKAPSPPQSVDVASVKVPSGCVTALTLDFGNADVPAKPARRERGASPKGGDVVLDEMQKELDEQGVHLRHTVVRTVCECQDILQRIDEVAKEFASARPHETTEQRRRVWADRITELTADCRQKLTDIDAPSAPTVPSELLTLSLHTTGQLAHAKRLQENLLAALRSDDAAQQRSLAGGLLDEHSTEHRPAPPPRSLASPPPPAQRRSFASQGGFRNRSAVLKPQQEPARSGAWKPALSPQAPGRMRPPPSPALGGSPTPSAVGRRQRADPRELSREDSCLPEDLPPSPETTSPKRPPAGLETIINQSQLLSAGLYLQTEALLHEARAERALIFKYQDTKDELQAVSCAGHGLPRAGQLRIPPTSGLIGAVFASRVAVNLSNGSAVRDILGFKTEKVVSLLALPIWGSSNRATVAGVAVLINKNRGKSPFIPEDETFLCTQLPIIAYFLERYPLDIAAFDPSGLHSMVTLKAQEPPPKVIGHGGVEGHNPRHLIYRTREFGMYMRKQVLQTRGEEIGSAAGLQEVASYIQNLEECWDASIRSHLDVEDSVQAYLEQTRVMRDQVKKKARKIAMLKELVKSHADENIRLTAELKILSQDKERQRVQLPSVFQPVVF